MTAAAAEDTAVTFNVITNADGTSDLPGADGGDAGGGDCAGDGWRRDGRVYNWRTAPSPLRRRRVLRALRSFNYTITDQDGDTSTATVTVTVAADSVPSLVSTTQPDG